MRRPLFLVCLCLVALFACKDISGMQTDLSDENYIVTGRVYQKETDCIYLDSVVLELTDVDQTYSNSLFSETDAANQQQIIPFTDNLICEYAKAQEILLGSTVRFSGRIRRFSHATNPGEFDSAQYYHSLQIGGKLQDVVLLEAGEEYSEWREALWRVREYFKERLYHVFPVKEASIMSAMLLGDKSTLEPEIKALYQSNGIVHILSISGLHITIIGMSLFRLLRRMGAPVWVAAIAGGMVLFLYGVMTGLSVSACRAIGMYLLRMLSEAVGRTYDMLTALGVTAVVTLWVNPGYLYNAGFYLSYGAVLGIGILYPALLPLRKKETLLKYVGDRRKQIVYRIAKIVREKLTRSMLASLTITLTTLPIQLWFFYEVPVYSLILNLLVIPFMSVVMACGIFAMLIPGLGIIGTVDCLILSGYEILCKSFEQLPFHTWNPGKPEGWQVVIYYTLLLVCCWVSSYGKQMHTSQEAARKLRGEERHKLCVNPWKELHGKSRKELRGRLRQELCRKSWKELYGRLRQELCRKSWKELYRRLRKNLCRRLDGRLWKVIPGMLTIAVIVLGVRIPGPTTITFLDVGQGDCICMQTTSGEVYLFDCGSTSRSLVGEYVLKPYLKYEGIRHIDGIFVSHSDSDHYNGVQELLENQNEWGITVDNLVLPGEIVAGDTWECESGSVRFTCLHPSALEAFEDSNAFSQCFYVEIADAMSLLLTGDVEGEGEAQLLQELQKRNITQATVLKVAHHGSRYSTSEAFLEQCKPKVAIISAGRNNSYGHPHEALLERLDVSGALIWSTQEYGAITIEVGEKLKLRSWLSFE